MSDAPTNLTAEQIQNIAGKIIVIKSEIAELEEARENLQKVLDANLGDGDHYEGDFRIEIFQGKMLNAAYAKKNQPELYAKGVKLVETFNATTAKELLSEEEYALVQKPNDKRTVKVSLRDD